MTPFGKFLNRTLRSLTQHAVDQALKDTGASAGDVELVVFGNAMAGMVEGQECVRAESALGETETLVNSGGGFIGKDAAVAVSTILIGLNKASGRGVTR
jgi:acetyl-CoA acetyltransferase